MKQPMSSSLVMPEETKYEPLTDIIRDENQEPITEPAVVDTDSADSNNANTEETLPPSEDSKYQPLNEIQDNSNPNLEDATEAGKDKNDEPEKDENQEGSVVEKPEETNQTGDEINPFDFLVEGGLLNIPEGFEYDGTEESFNQLMQYDQQVRDYQALNRIEQSIQDPKVFELIQHGIEGGKFADMQSMFEATQQQLNLETLDTSKEADAEKILNRYYAEVAKFSKDQAARYIDAAKDRETLEEDAKHAKAHYEKYYADEKARITQEAAAKKAQANQEFKQRIQGVAQSVQEKGYQGDVVKGISTLLSPVQDGDNQQVFKENGTPMLWYEVQVERIAENPAHLAEFLSLLQAYDEQQGFNRVQEQKQKTQTSSKNKSAFELFNKIKREKAGSSGEGNNSSKPYIPPAPDSYDI